MTLAACEEALLQALDLLHEQPWIRAEARHAQADAAAASVTNVKDSLQFLVERAFIPKIFTLPIQRMPSGCLNTAFSHDLICSWL